MPDVEEKLKSAVEPKIFGVCSRMAEYMGIPISTVRKYFIYTSIITLGSSVILYLILHFWINVNSYRHRKKPSVWDL